MTLHIRYLFLCIKSSYTHIWLCIP